MHKEILSKEQLVLLPIIGKFSDKFGLVGGTAIALHLGHRESIDFDLFSSEPFENSKVKQKLRRLTTIDRITFEDIGQLNIELQGVKLTFFEFSYPVEYSENVLDYIKIPDLLTLAAMKAFALGGRAKWKDYVDLYFILKDHYSVAQIIAKAQELFSGEFNDKLFQVQLGYFDKMNYSEPIVFKNNYSVFEKEVKEFLLEKSLE
ncbi:MAG: hypothetical protein COV07_01580 [Candidatus Vogelbacteria bacterium CG10_big_fil_rev_8_21_14_0_10_45_14]|uniref:Nucleotidyl transferase AbiEii/AbiGii toxin family protein n=1 Tax=Candidatus Vogelbacteria bacterium CG10_big_fil_rev_8_21_14_0_10_45_14 TaxID=1975042 RepID=A0A2H0RMC7_9BACT|nr:MAG: hypothetical protein COV07_01580 [Candidatus Vogelbacteria bacterium CG10_big_fil_rev_8_21_14_0_10_45_14]